MEWPACSRSFLPPWRLRRCRLSRERTQLQLIVCGRTIETAKPNGAPRVVARAPRGVGHWVWAEYEPRGDRILAQWSAACEGARTRLASERRGCDPLSERSVRRLDPRTRHVCGAPPRQAAPHPAHAALRAVPDVERLVGLPRRYERVRSNPVSQDGRASRARAALYAAPPSRRLSLAAVRRPCRRRPRGRTRRPPARRRRRRVTAGARRSR